MTTGVNSSAITTLEEQYRLLVEGGHVASVQTVVRDFKYPSRRVTVPTMTTYGADDPSRPEKVARERLAKLESSSQ